MSVPSRASLLTKSHKVLKKHYKPVPPADRPLLQQLLYACCLENSSYEAADKAFAQIEQSFYDWNEARVSSVAELAEAMSGLHDPRSAAWNFKRTLHSAFETTYSFDLELLKKKTIGQAIKEIEKLEGVTPFALAYVNQTALGGHAIAVDRGAIHVLLILGAASEKEAASGSIPGLERAIPKSKGIEYASLLHQLAADFLARPFSTEVRDILLSIAPDAKERLPKRGGKKRRADKGTDAAAAGANGESGSAAANGAQAKKKKRAASAKQPRPATSSKKGKKTASPRSSAKGLSKSKPR